MLYNMHILSPIYMTLKPLRLGAEAQNIRIHTVTQLVKLIIIHQVYTMEVMAVTVFQYLILMSKDVYDFIFSIFFSIEKICRTLKTAFDHISINPEVRPSYFQLYFRCSEL